MSANLGRFSRVCGVFLPLALTGALSACGLTGVGGGSAAADPGVVALTSADIMTALSSLTSNGRKLSQAEALQTIGQSSVGELYKDAMTSLGEFSSMPRLTIDGKELINLNSLSTSFKAEDLQTALASERMSSFVDEAGGDFSSLDLANFVQQATTLLAVLPPDSQALDLTAGEMSEAEAIARVQGSEDLVNKVQKCADAQQAKSSIFSNVLTNGAVAAVGGAVCRFMPGIGYIGKAVKYIGCGAVAWSGATVMAATRGQHLAVTPKVSTFSGTIIQNLSPNATQTVEVIGKYCN